MKRILSILIFTSAIPCFSQSWVSPANTDIYPPGPEAAGLLKPAQAQISMYTGQAQVSIPLYTIEANGITIPIALDYSTGGIKVEEMPARVGLGWSLNAGGLISRTVRGFYDDKQSGGYLYQSIPASINVGDQNQFNQLENLCNNIIDWQPDEYFYSFLGHSGMFLFDDSDLIRLIPYENYVVTGRPQQDPFTMTTDDGIKYSFNYILSANQSVNVNGSDDHTSTYQNCWYLTKIEFPDKSGKVGFYYGTPDVFNQYYYQYSTEGQCDNDDENCVPDRSVTTTKTYCQNSEAVLDSIVFPGGVVLFSPGNQRQDIPGNYTLGKVIIKDAFQNVIKSFSLKYSYFGATGNLRLRLDEVVENDPQGNSLNPYKFIYNNSVTLPSFNTGATDFTKGQDHWGYYNGTANTNTIPVFLTCDDGRTTFGNANRNADSIKERADILKKIIYPSQGWVRFDYEGNYYGFDNFGHVVFDTLPLPLDSVNANVYADACPNHSCQDTAFFTLICKNRISINANYTNSGNTDAFTELKSTDGKIDIVPYSGIRLDTLLPAGQYLAIASLNGYTGQALITISYPTSCDTIIKNYKLAGGLRIHRVTYSDGDADSSNDLVKIYNYKLPHQPDRSSGEFTYAPVYSYNFEKVQSFLINGQTFWDSCKLVKGFSSSQATEENSKSGIVAYTDVDEIPCHHQLSGGKDTLIADNGRIHYHFSFTPNLNWLNDFPFPPIYNNEYQRGNLLDETYYNSKNNPIRKIHNHYLSVNDQNFHLVQGIKAAIYKAKTQINNDQIAYEYYNYTSQFYCHDSTITTDYDLYDSTRKVISGTSDFYTNPVHEEITKTVTVRSDGAVVTQYFRYPPDYGVHNYSGSGAMMQSLDQMSNYLHMHNVVIESYTTINKGGTDSVISGEVTRFRMFNGKPVKDTVYQLDLQNPIPLSSFTVSNTNGNKFNKDSRYRAVFFYSAYDDSLMPVTFYQPFGQHTSAVYNYPRYKVEAVSENADRNSMAYTGFEEGDKGGGWSFPVSGIQSPFQQNISTAATGNYLFAFSKGSITMPKPPTQYEYILSFWYAQKGQGGQNPANNITISCPAMSILKNTIAEIVGDWTYTQLILSFQQPGPGHPPSADSIKITGGSKDLIDELRLYPYNAYMKTVAYKNMNDISELCDENNIINHFSYDNFDRFNYSSDHYLNGLSYTEYHYKDTSNSSDHNYIRTDIAHTLNLSQNQLSSGTLSNTQSTRTKQFFDGLERIIQTISVQQSPTGQDIVTPVVYDAFGRNRKKYLPFPYSAGGSFLNNAISAQASFYSASNDIVNNTTHIAFAQDSFETDPLNRVIISAFPGETWEMNEANVVTGFRTNASNEVRLWNYNKSGSTWTGTVFYPAGTLYVTEITDENGTRSKVYKDKTGNTILEAHQKHASSTTTLDTNYIQTYYLFNNMLQLGMVITPQCMRQMEKSNNYTLTKTLADQLNFRYSYNQRGLVNGKKIPGQGWTYYVYDRLDRVVLTQDSNLRPLSKWFYQKYDVHGHQVISGIAVLAGNSRDQLQSTFWNSTALYESRAPGLTGYTNNIIPQSGANQLINYYDDYDFNDNGTDDYKPADDSIARTLNRLTGTFTRDLVYGAQEQQANFYDYHYRLIESSGLNFESGSEHVSNQYDFAGNLLSTIHQHGARPVSPIGGLSHVPGINLLMGNIKIFLPSFNVTHRYQYDFGNRKTDEFITVNSHKEIQTAQIGYNSLGKMSSKQLYLGALNFAQQKMDYRYNIRAWLTDINDISRLSNTSDTDYFAEKLHYDDGNDGGKEPGTNNHGGSMFNGNISYTEWGTNLNGTKRQYYCDYDLLNRLTFAYYQAYYGSAPGSAVETDRYDVSNLTYDDNGNIYAMKVGGVINNNNNTFTFGTSDNLTYTYTGNQLQKVSDAGNGGWSKGLDFRDGGNSGNDFTYDGNGNMISDQNKGLTITFNQLNLPQTIAANSSNTLNITYDASGGKLKESNNVNGKRDSILYFNDILEEGKGKRRILFGDGYIIDRNDTLTDYFYEKDHLGNVRIVFAADSNLWNAYTLSMEPGHDSIGTGYGKFQNVDQFREAQEFYQGHFGAHLHQQSGPFIELPAHNNDSLTAKVYYYYLNTQNPQHPKSKDSLSHILPVSIGITPVPQLANPDVDAKPPHAVLSLGFNLGGLFQRFRSNEGKNITSAPQTLPNAYLDILLEDSAGNQLQEWKQTITQQGNQWNVLGDSFKIHLPDTANKKYKFHISLVNEDNTDVWFDTLRIAQAQTTGPIVQVNDYYPFGNLIDGIRYQASNPDTNMYRYNGKQWEEAFKLNLYDYNKRWFDPQIGRFIEVDGLADKFPNLSQYQYASDDPIKNVDLDGLEGIPSSVNGNGQYTAAQSSTWVKPPITLTALPPTMSYGEQQAHLSAATSVSDRVREANKAAYNRQEVVNTLSKVETGLLSTAATFMAGEIAEPLLTGAGAGIFNGGSKELSLADKYMNIAKTGDFSTSESSAVFYSGPDQKSIATSFINSNLGKATIEMTKGGKVLEDAKLFENLDNAIARSIWVEASSNFAKGAAGEVNAFVKGASSNGVYTQVEKPILSQNQFVRLIEHK